MKNSNKKGFTLVELLIVIAIISILTALIITNIYSSRGKARDAKRISDIAQLQLALEQYFNKFGVYPDLQARLVSDYISVLPKDPDSGLTYTYNRSNDKYDYVLSANLEYVNGATADSLPEDPYQNIPVKIFCNPIGLVYCVGPK